MGALRTAALAFMMCFALHGAAFAHAKMSSSVPKDGATVAAGLTELQLDFTKPMRLTVVHITSGADKRVVALKSALQQTFVQSAKVAVEPLAPGAYDVSWTAVADDGHVMNGAFKFTVTGEAATTPSP